MSPVAEVMGGFTEAGDAELTDRELMAQGRHKSPKVLAKCVKKTMRQVASGIQMRTLPERTEDICRNEQQRGCRNE